MKNLLLICTVLIATISGCKKSNDPVVDAETQEAQRLVKLHEQFHGKYRIVSSIADQELDINMDGLTSTDLLKEIPAFQFENHPHIVEVRIYGKSNMLANSSLIISQGWPEQYISIGNKQWDGGPGLEYNANLAVNYVHQGSVRSFRFSDDLKEIIVEPSENERPFRWVAPESVKIDELDRLHFINKRYLYTKDGVKQVKITSVYERVTKQT
ncbi:hypothetical protein [Dyadobacter crusticola]|uniref:hypothetical protein n=1 Tax=Dyadobacter crusticola TaxID=292407 RepID=UPI0004E180DE|nr:hypothetical protein [Dyadobacter crusticola]